ncbi:NAD(P)-binding protein [Decorospora gaudefroyi]|uniref:NAD(P)-binding protein n=1 Tax=Decorospora gaudefroyi TaxID=184978 RepID=A0A6A5KUE8_9PLEO|nr:NAD(P)-binding protein [Decorospora gaudefroyi]
MLTFYPATEPPATLQTSTQDPKLINNPTNLYLPFPTSHSTTREEEQTKKKKMPTPTILITGASSGLGHAFTTHYASQPTPPTILALDTRPFPQTSPSRKESTIQFHEIDITSEVAVQRLASSLASVAINLVIHCAGVRGLVPNAVAQERQKGENEEKSVAATERLGVMDKDTMTRTFEVNTFGAFNVVKAFSPNLLLERDLGAGRPPRVVVMSSRMGSVSSNTTGGGYAYRASKAALNAVVKSFVIDVPDVRFLMMHPGRVETRLVEWKEEGAIGVEESVKDCLQVFEGLEKGAWDGRLVDRFGEVIAW